MLIMRDYSWPNSLHNFAKTTYHGRWNLLQLPNLPNQVIVGVNTARKSTKSEQGEYIRITEH